MTSMSMTGETSDFWQEHSLKYLEMAFRTDRQGCMEKPDGYAKKTGDCGDTIEMYLSVKDNRIDSLMFEVSGCMNTNATSNTVAELAEGKTLEEAWEITPEMVSDYLESLPPDHFHCAELAIGTFYLALSDCKETARNPWKKAYK